MRRSRGHGADHEVVLPNRTGQGSGDRWCDAIDSAYQRSFRRTEMRETAAIEYRQDRKPTSCSKGAGLIPETDQIAERVVTVAEIDPRYRHLIISQLFEHLTPGRQLIAAGRRS